MSNACRRASFKGMRDDLVSWYDEVGLAGVLGLLADPQRHTHRFRWRTDARVPSGLASSRLGPMLSCESAARRGRLLYASLCCRGSTLSSPSACSTNAQGGRRVPEFGFSVLNGGGGWPDELRASPLAVAHDRNARNGAGRPLERFAALVHS
jgi:hypothetical protein